MTNSPEKLQEDLTRQPLEGFETPTLIRNDKKARVWWCMKDDQFGVLVFIHFRTPMAYVTPRATVLNCLYVMLVNDTIDQYLQGANTDAVGYQLKARTSGLTLSVQGYSQEFLGKVLMQMRDLEVREDRFKIVCDGFSNDVLKPYSREPYLLVNFDSERLQSETYFTTDDLLKELGSVTVQDVEQFFPQMLAQGHIEVLSQNLNKEDALNIAGLAEAKLKPKSLSPNQWPIGRRLILPPGSNFVYKRVLEDLENVNHCIEYKLSVGNSANPVVRAQLRLFVQMTLNQPNTIQQLGYPVFVVALDGPSYAEYMIAIQSVKDCPHLEMCIEHFLTSFERTIDEMSEEDFQNHKVAAIEKHLKEFEDDRDWPWLAILSEHCDFLRYETNVKYLKPLTKKEMSEFYLHHISPSSPHRAKLSVHLIAQKQMKDLTLEEQKTKIAVILETIFKAEKITRNESALKSRIKTIASESDILSAISLHLKDDLNLDAEKIKKMLGNTKAALGLAHTGSGGEDVPADEAMTVTGVQGGHAKEPVLITDERGFKANLQLSEGVKPVHNLKVYTVETAR